MVHQNSCLANCVYTNKQITTVTTPRTGIEPQGEGGGGFMTDS